MVTDDPATGQGVTILASRRRTKPRVRGALGLCSWAYLVGSVGLWVLLQWADDWWVATLSMFLPRWLFAIPLVILVPAAFWVRSRTLVAQLLFTGVVVGNATGFNVPWQKFAVDLSQHVPFRVMTCNLHGNWRDPPEFEALIEDTQVDVVAVQEWPGAQWSALQTVKGWHVYNSPRLFLASRYPIRAAINLGDNPMDEFASATRYDLETPIGVVHLFNLHLATNRYGLNDVVHDNRKGAREISANSTRRTEQSERLAAKAAEVRERVLVVGDFNTPPESRIFPQAWSDYEDAFGAAGWGWGYTFLEMRTMVRIDHVLTGTGWTCNRCWVGPDVGSPHRPVIAELYWTGR